jgi:ATP-dependent helicase Lhr and Lhr-like helicase
VLGAIIRHLMDRFSDATRRWFSSAFPAPTEVQRSGWERIQAGDHTLLIAPTGSGKTLAAFLFALDEVGRLPADMEPGVRVLYVSPLKALVYDIERNLRTPLAGIAHAASAAAEAFRVPRVDVRTGDTPPHDRRRQVKDPGEIMVTTPESLFLLLGSTARETLRTVRWVIVDEIHALAPTKRGSHLALSLERLTVLAEADPQRIGLSATARPAEEVARFLGGDRPVTVVDAHVAPALDLHVVVPVEDMTRPVVEAEGGGFEVLPAGERPSGSLMLAEEEETTRQYGIWPSVYPKILELIRAHRTTLVFVNSRALCERLAQRLNEQAGEELVRAHHGSLAHDQRREIEEALKAGHLPAIVATSSLELGIDMGAVDMVVLVESPGSVASGLQRVGRAGHQVGERSAGRIFPKHRGDLLEAAVVAQRMREGAIESIRIPRNPLDVLAQHIVAMASVQSWRVPELAAAVRRAAGYRDLPDAALTGVLDMLSGLYPSHAFAELRPRITWDRQRDAIEARRGARMLVAVNAGTIPDRGLFGVHLGEGGPRVGELDEEMVHESQPGQTFMLGATTWRIQEITRDRVIVEPAPGEPGRLPFWKGEGPGRPLELGRALGRFTRQLSALGEAEAMTLLQGHHGLDRRAAANLVGYLAEQREATGSLPTDRNIVVERFRDELGDWRVCILTPFGARVHAPWALALRGLVSEQVGYEVQVVWSDDGVVLTVADGDEPPDVAILVPDPEEMEERLIAELARSPLFASQFRENAARALLLPRRRPGQRTPLFAQRLRAQKLMAIAMEFPSFPMVMETYRACLQDVFDLPALKDVLRSVESGEIRVHDVETPSASPFARSLVYAYVASYLYEGDSPAAERRAQALAVDMGLLRELLGEADLRELLDADVLAAVEAELQHRSEGRRARHLDALHDLLRDVGDLTLDEARDRSASDPAPWLRDLERTRRAVRVRLAGQEKWIAVEDVGLYRDALGTAPPAGVATAYLAPVVRPVEALLLRFARTHGPFSADDVSARYGLVASQARLLLEAAAAEGRLVRGEFTPGGTGEEWVDPDVLRQVKRRTIAKLRGEVAPVDPLTLARFLPSWHRAGPEQHERLEDAIAQLEGIPLSYRDLVRAILPARVRGFRPEQLDELGSMGWLVWVGHSPLRNDDGRIQLFRRDRVDRLLIPPDPDALGEGLSEPHRVLFDHMARRGASFHAELVGAVPEVPADRMLTLLWDLVWAGLVTNDTFGALRSLGSRVRGSRGRRGEGETGPVAPVRRREPRRLRAWRPTGLAPSATGGAAGRWSLVRDLARAPIAPTERAAGWAATLLDRHGLVLRETAAVEALGGGFSSVYKVLRTLEESGKVRRGYFVEGLGGAQFAYPGIVDRLRRVRDGAGGGETVVLAATDPANAYGWLIPWPQLRGKGRGAARATGAAVVLVDGSPVLFLDRRGRRLRTFEGTDETTIARALPRLRDMARTYPRRSLSLDEVDGEPAFRSALKPLLEEAGFTPDYRYIRISGE